MFPAYVAENNKINWASALWKWRDAFRTEVYGPSVRYGQFGSSTKGLYGETECKKDSDNLSAKKRFEMYSHIAKIFNLFETPNELGCYNLTNTRKF